MIETGTRTAEIGSPSWSVPDHDIERIKMMLEQSGIDVQITNRPSFFNGRPMTITLTGDLGTVDGMSDTPDDIQANLSMELKSKGYASVMDKIADAVKNDKTVAPVFTGPSKVRISPKVNPEFYREKGLKSGDPSPHTMNAIDTLRPILRKYGYKSMVRDDGYKTTLYVKIPDMFIGDFDQISKHIGEPGDGKVKPKMEAVDESYQRNIPENLLKAAEEEGLSNIIRHPIGHTFYAAMVRTLKKLLDEKEARGETLNPNECQCHEWINQHWDELSKGLVPEQTAFIDMLQDNMNFDGMDKK